MRRILYFAAVSVVALVLGQSSVVAAGAEELMSAFRAMEEPALSESQIYFASDYAIESQDFSLQLDSAFVHFFEPIEIDGAKHLWGAYIQGKGIFRFAPPTRMEQQQARLFLQTDSLYRRFFEGIILFNDTTATDLMAGTRAVKQFRGELDRKAIRESFEALQNNENELFLFETLRNTVYPLRRPFLIASIEPEKTDRLVYMFDPYLREEVKLYKDYKEFLVSLYFEQVCSYSVYADESHVRVNGIARERIEPTHYTIDATIASNGDLKVTSRMKCAVRLSPTQLIVFRLHPELAVDKITVGENDVEFLRYESWENKSDTLYVFLDRAYNKGDTIDITVSYAGDMVPPNAPVFLLQGDENWYPTYRLAQQATFDLHYTVPKDFPFYSTGELVSDSSDARQRTMHWQVAEPVSDVSFTIGEYDQYQYATEVAPIEIFVSDALHREMRQQLAGSMRFGDRHAERSVADDVSQALKLFNHYFGEYDRDKLIVSESYISGGRSTPGMVHLNWEAVFSADLWGENRLHRSGTVAQQWWGSGVLAETYRDRWLSEGFSAYSGLLFLQAAEGNDQFMWWLDQYADEIISLDRLVRKDDKPTPPIALGRRASCSETNIYSKSLSDMFGAAGTASLGADVNRSEFEIEQTDIMMEGDPDDPKDDQQRINVRRRDPKTRAKGPGDEPMISSPQADTLRADYYTTIHHKGAFVLHMIRNLLMDLETLDDSKFYTLMKDWYVTYNGRQASTQEFRRMTEKYTGLDMGWFFDQWVYGSAIPTYEFSYDIEDEKEDGRWKASVTIEQKDVPETFQMFVPIEIKFRGDKRFYMRLLVDRPELTVQLPPMDEKPEKITLNPFHSVLARVKQ